VSDTQDVAVQAGRVGFLWMAVSASLAVHALLGWSLITGDKGNLNPAGAQPRPVALSASLAAAPAGRHEVVPPKPEMPAPQTAPVQAPVAVPPAAVRDASPSQGLDPSADEIQTKPQTEGPEDRQASTQQDPYGDYLPSNTLDIIPMPISRPDSKYLEGMVLNESPVAVKVYVDATGRVQNVAVRIPESEQEAAAPLRTMFEETRFIPGRKDGKAVPSVMDVQINISDVLGVRHFN
jgi:hypothetical protein